MKKTPKTNPYPVRLTKEARTRVNRTARIVSLPVADTVRHAIDLGLPILERKLKPKPSVVGKL